MAKAIKNPAPKVEAKDRPEVNNPSHFMDHIFSYSLLGSFAVIVLVAAFSMI